MHLEMPRERRAADSVPWSGAESLWTSPEPFETLLSEKIRQVAARKAEADIVEPMEDVFRAGGDDTTHEPELALAGQAFAPTAPAVRTAQGLKEKTMVDPRGRLSNPPKPVEAVIEQGAIRLSAPSQGREDAS